MNYATTERDTHERYRRDNVATTYQDTHKNHRRKKTIESSMAFFLKSDGQLRLGRNR